MPQDNRGLFLPELMEPTPGPWKKHEVDIQEAAVDTQNREAWIPKAHTPAQRLARLHEGGHVKYSPRDWEKRWLRTTKRASAKLGKPVDPAAVLKILKMLEENRIDWLLWDKHAIDLRPAREALDWGKMPDPATVLGALGMCLQLAWTVWASRGLGSKSIPNPPPSRTPDPDTGEYFDKCWAVVGEESSALCVAMIQGCLRMYTHPTHEMRDEVAAELATFFPLIEEEEEKPPPQKPAEKAAQEEAEREEKELEDYHEDLETGHGSEVVTHGRVQYHDHTATVRRPSMRIARRHVPVSRGVGVRFAHRYFLDKAIFSQRLLTEAGIMVDGSGSMNWTDDDMQALMQLLPAVTVGVYSGLKEGNIYDETSYIGRICTIAKGGRFAKYTGIDKECDGGNDVDVEALQLLARWPKPRLWLSDGIVCGGVHRGPPRYVSESGYVDSIDGRIHELCNQLMKTHEIYRVPDREIMRKLLKRERVTLYRSTRNGPEEQMGADSCWPTEMRPEPIRFQL